MCLPAGFLNLSLFVFLYIKPMCLPAGFLNLSLFVFLYIKPMCLPAVFLSLSLFVFLYIKPMCLPAVFLSLTLFVFLYIKPMCLPAGFLSLSLSDQMVLLQSTWLDIQCFNLVYHSSPYQGILVFADDFKCSEEDTIKMGLPLALDAASRQLARKLSLLKITKEEYVLMKAILVLNPGTHAWITLCGILCETVRLQIINDVSNPQCKPGTSRMIQCNFVKC